MDTFTKQGMILVGCVCAVLLFLVIASGGSDDKESSQVATSIQSEPGESAIDPQTNEPNPEAIDPVKWRAAKVQRGIPRTLDLSLKDAPKEIGAFALKVPVVNDLVGVNVRFTSERRCETGDLDLLIREKTLDRSSPFLLTLERLDGMSKSKGKENIKVINPRNIETGMSAALAVPPSKSPVHYGLFICRDSQNTGSCLDKRIENLNRLLSLHFNGTPDKPADRVYFFQYLVLENNTFTAVNSLMDRKSYSSLEKYLAQRTRNQFGAKNMSAKAQNINQTIRSAPVQVTENGFVANLPRHDRGLCQKEAPLQLSAEQLRKVREINERRRKKGLIKK